MSRIIPLRPRFAPFVACASLLSLALAPAALADPPVGSFTIDMPNDERVYRMPKQIPGFEFVDDMGCSKLKGGLDGRWRASCQIDEKSGGFDIEADGDLRVHFLTKNGQTKLKIDLEMDGKAEDGPIDADFEVEAEGKALIPDGSSFVDVDVDLEVCLKDRGVEECFDENVDMLLPIETGDQGFWSIDVQIHGGLGEMPWGDAVVSVAGKDIDYTVKVVPVVDDGTWKLKLKPLKEKWRGDSFIKIVDAVVTDGVLTGVLKYDVYGQKGVDIPVSVPVVSTP